MVRLQQLSTLELVLDTPKGTPAPHAQKHRNIPLIPLSGRGIFTTRPIPAGSSIDTAAVIILPEREFTEHYTHTLLLHYSYNWPVPAPPPAPEGSTVLRQAVVLGLGSMFNHSARKQNVGWKRNLEAEVVVYTALRDIAEGEELLISYGPHLTFVDVDEAEREVEEETGEGFLGGFGLDL
jgi:hypothetical protein